MMMAMSKSEVSQSRNHTVKKVLHSNADQNQGKLIELNRNLTRKKTNYLDFRTTDNRTFGQDNEIF